MTSIDRRLWNRIVLTAVIAVVGLAAVHANAQDKTSLWKVTSGKGTVYLLGSIHLLGTNDYPLDKRMDDAFEKSDAVVFEVVPDSLQSPSLQADILRNAMYGEGKTLRSELGDSVYAAASAAAESLGIDLGALGGFKPWFVSIALALAEMQRMGFDPELGVEMHFAEKAKAESKTVLGLETAQYQLGLFIALTPEQQRDLLMHTVSQLSDIRKELDEISAAWKKGDLDVLDATLNKSFDEFPAIYEKLVVERNRNWVGEIDRFLADGRPHLVVVGVGHMPGPNGLIELLKKKGYRVEQL